MKSKSLLLSLFIFSLFSSVLVQAQTNNTATDPHAGHQMANQEPLTKSDSNDEYLAANNKMHKDMAIKLTGNADIDFLSGMIPHHQGAIDMAKVVLKYGKDPKVKKLAEDIIKAQEKEIATMQEWLKQQQYK